MQRAGHAVAHRKHAVQRTESSSFSVRRWLPRYALPYSKYCSGYCSVADALEPLAMPNWWPMWRKRFRQKRPPVTNRPRITSVTNRRSSRLRSSGRRTDCTCLVRSSGGLGGLADARARQQPRLPCGDVRERRIDVDAHLRKHEQRGRERDVGQREVGAEELAAGQLALEHLQRLGHGFAGGLDARVVLVCGLG